MESTGWRDGIESVLAELESSGGAIWPAAACRIMAVQRDQEIQVVVANFQAMVTRRDSHLELVHESPMVLEGKLALDDLRRLLEAWGRGEPYSHGDWCLTPPKITFAHWTPGVASRGDPPLFEPFPPHESAYRVHRLSANGDNDHEAGRALHAAASNQQIFAQQWSKHYLGLPNYTADLVYFVIQLPVPVAVDATYDPVTRTATAEVFYRRPFGAADFWVRFGDRWDASMARHEVHDESDAGGGWFVARCSTQLKPDDGQVRAWAGWISRPNHFEWHTGRPLGLPVNCDAARVNALPAFYTLSHASLADHVRQAEETPIGAKNQRASGVFELAIANACGALGFPILFGGRALATPNVDLVVFDADAGTAYSVSVTISNSIREKARGLRLAQARLEAALAPTWTVKSIIVTVRRPTDILPSDQAAAAQDQVLVLTHEDIQGLMDEPPELRALQQALRRAVPMLPSP